MNPQFSAEDANERRRFQHPDGQENPADVFAEVEARPASVTRGERRRLPRPRPPRRGRQILKKLIAFVLAIAVLAILGYAIYIFTILSGISTNSLNFGPLAADASGRTNILILGTGDPGHDGQDLTDAMMLLSIDGPGHRMAQVSIPRDLRVNISGYGYGKINSANAYGGVSLARSTVSSAFDVPVDYYIETNFSGLQEVVDAVGGLDINVKERLTDREYPCDDNQYKVCGLDIQRGLQHMDGSQVLKYVRCRKGTCGNDFGRAERQQEVIGLLRPKITDWQLVLNPVKLKELVTALQKGVKTDLGMVQLLMLGQAVKQAGDNAPVHLVLSTAPGGYLRDDPRGSSDLLPESGDFSEISARIQAIFEQTP